MIHELLDRIRRFVFTTVTVKIHRQSGAQFCPNRLMFLLKNNTSLKWKEPADPQKHIGSSTLVARRQFKLWPLGGGTLFHSTVAEHSNMWGKQHTSMLFDKHRGTKIELTCIASTSYCRSEGPALPKADWRTHSWHGIVRSWIWLNPFNLEIRLCWSLRAQGNKCFLHQFVQFQLCCALLYCCPVSLCALDDLVFNVCTLLLCCYCFDLICQLMKAARFIWSISLHENQFVCM